MTDYNALRCEAAAYARAHAAEERARELEAEVERLRREISLWREYEQFLHDANEDPIWMASIHGWRCATKTFERGMDYRRRLGILRTGDEDIGAVTAGAAK